MKGYFLVSFVKKPRARKEWKRDRAREIATKHKCPCQVLIDFTQNLEQIHTLFKKDKPLHPTARHNSPNKDCSTARII